MPSYEHTRIIGILNSMDALPSAENDRAEWLRAKAHVEFLIDNATSDEVILCAFTSSGGAYRAKTYIHAEIVAEKEVIGLDLSGLKHWSSNPFGSRADYSWSSGQDGVHVGYFHNSSPGVPLNLGQLVFGRSLEGIDDHNYFELLQEFVHAAGIHWRDEHRAYCRLDRNGDLEPVVSITNRRDSDSPTLITCRREPLEQYLKATGTYLIRFFEIMIINREKFHSWDGADREEVEVSEDLFLHQTIHRDEQAFTRGVQIIRVNKSWDEVFPERWGLGDARGPTDFASFTIDDWRNGKIAEVSTAPEDSTNFFVADQNSLPFELSPAFFRPEVLSKYKTDRDKYTIDEEHRFIECRGAWHLKTYDINDAGQVHTYLCYLRDLPIQEQFHWKGFNENPKAPISKRAWENDFQAQPSDDIKPLVKVLWILREWARTEVSWWHLQDQRLFSRVNTPVTASRSEWALAFEDLAKVVIEGFQERRIRQTLESLGIPFDEKDRSLVLLEKLLTGIKGVPGELIKIPNIRLVQRIRTLTQAHAGGSEAEDLAKRAQTDFGSYKEHFEHVCEQVAEELEMIEGYLGRALGDDGSRPRASTEVAPAIRTESGTRQM